MFTKGFILFYYTGHANIAINCILSPRQRHYVRRISLCFQRVVQAIKLMFIEGCGENVDPHNLLAVTRAVLYLRIPLEIPLVLAHALLNCCWHDPNVPPWSMDAVANPEAHCDSSVCMLA